MVWCIRNFCWILLVAILAAPSGCQTAASETTQKPRIVASIFPVASLLEQLTGDWANVVTLLPASESPHNVELTPDQIRLLTHADILVVVGDGLDPWAEKAAGAADSSELRVLRFSKMIGIAEIGSKPAVSSASAVNSANKHLWLDPVRASRFVQAAAERLKEIYPQHAASIAESAERLTKDLAAIDREYAEQLAKVRERRLITFHNAFDLIAERYHLEIVVRLTDIELTPGGEVTPDRLREALDAITRYKLKVLYAEPEFPDQVVRRLRDETGGVQVLTLDPQGNPAVEGYRTYQEMMRSNLRALVKGQNL